MRPRVSLWFPVFLYLVFMYTILPFTGDMTAWTRSHNVEWVIPYGPPALLALAGVLFFGFSLSRSEKPRWQLFPILVFGGLLYCLLMVRFTQVRVERFHVLLFAGLAFLVFRGYRQRTSGWRLYAYSMVLLASAGFVDEVIQGFMHTRLYDNRDIALNIASALVTLILLRLLDPTSGTGTRKTRFSRADGAAVLIALCVCMGMVLLRRTPVPPSRIVGIWEAENDLGRKERIAFTKEGKITWHDDSGNWAEGVYAAVSNPFDETLLSVRGTDAKNASDRGWQKDTKNSTLFYLQHDTFRFFKDPMTWKRIR